MEASSACGHGVIACFSIIFGPAGFLKTVPHTGSALLGLGGIIMFSIAMVWQRPFDATLAALLILLCQHIFALQNERLGLEAKLAALRPSQELAGSTAAAQPIAANEERHVPAPSEEMDLKSYAEALGVVAGGAAVGSGSDCSLSQILLTSLAKEYLRCVSALQSYKATFGGLEAASSPQKQHAEAGSAYDAALLDEVTTRVSPPASQVQVHSHLPQLGSAYSAETPQRLPLAPPLPLEAEEAGAGPALTPRSPRGPPSPEQQKRRRSSGGSAMEASPEPHRYVPAGTTASMGFAAPAPQEVRA